MQYWQNAEFTWKSMRKILCTPNEEIVKNFCGIYFVGITLVERIPLCKGTFNDDEYEEGALLHGFESQYKEPHWMYASVSLHKDSRFQAHNPFAKHIPSEDFLCGLGMAPLYVGMTTRPFEQRIKEHHVVWPLVEMPWIAFKCWPFPIGTPKEYLMELESVLINKFNPPLNKTRPTVDKTLFLPAVE